MVKNKTILLKITVNPSFCYHFSNLVVNTGIYYYKQALSLLSVIEKNKNNLRTSEPHFGQNLRTLSLILKKVVSYKKKCMVQKPTVI